MHTLTTMGPLGALARAASTNAKSADSRSAFSRSITGSHHGRQATSFVGSRRWLIAIRLAPVRCTPPRRRLQSTVRDGRSPGSRVVAVSRLPGKFPVAPAWGSSLTVAGAAPALRRTRTGFPFHLPRGRTIADDAIRRGSRGQPVRPEVKPEQPLRALPIPNVASDRVRSHSMAALCPTASRPQMAGEQHRRSMDAEQQITHLAGRYRRAGISASRPRRPLHGASPGVPNPVTGDADTTRVH